MSSSTSAEVIAMGSGGELIQLDIMCSSFMYEEPGMEDVTAEH